MDLPPTVPGVDVPGVPVMKYAQSSVSLINTGTPKDPIWMYKAKTYIPGHPDKILYQSDTLSKRTDAVRQINEMLKIHTDIINMW